jgi:hypothetical protein
MTWYDDQPADRQGALRAALEHPRSERIRKYADGDVAFGSWLLAIDTRCRELRHGPLLDIEGLHLRRWYAEDMWPAGAVEIAAFMSMIDGEAPAPDPDTTPRPTDLRDAVTLLREYADDVGSRSHDSANYASERELRELAARLEQRQTAWKWIDPAGATPPAQRIQLDPLTPEGMAIVLLARMLDSISDGDGMPGADAVPKIDEWFEWLGINPDGDLGKEAQKVLDRALADRD